MAAKKRIWVITDTHFGHDKIVDFCKRPVDHESKMLINLQRCVKDDDIVIHLGDVCFGDEEQWHKSIREMCGNAKMWLVLGNHDHKSPFWYVDHGWDFAAHSIGLSTMGHNILFSHVPIAEDDWYTLNIHGHFHNSPVERHEPYLYDIRNNKQFLLAMEFVGYRPVDLANIVSIQNGKKI